MAQGSVVETSLPRTLDIVEDDILDDAEHLEEEEFVDPPPPPEPGEELPPTPAELAEQERQDVLRARARRAGWVPREEFRGDPKDWRDYEDFLRRGEEILPIMQRQLRGAEGRADNLEKEVRALKATVEQQGSTIQELRTMNTRAEQQGYDRAIADLKIKRRDAAANGDMVGFAEFDEQIEDLETRRDTAARAAPQPPAPKPADQPQPQPQVALQPEIEKFIAENTWFLGPRGDGAGADMVLHAAMQEEHKKLLEDAPGMSLADNLEVAKARVQKRFPEKFGMAPSNKDTTRQRRPAPHTPGSGGPAGRQRATGIAAIADPQEREQARLGFESARRTMPDLTEETYLEIYNDPKGDVLDVQRRENERRNARATQRRRA